MTNRDLIPVKRTVHLVSGCIGMAICVFEAKNSFSYTRTNKYPMNRYIEPM